MWVLSHALPRSPPVACARAVFLSTTEPTAAVRQFSTKLGACFVGSFRTSVCASVAAIIAATLAGVKPNWVRMKPGLLFSVTTRWSEKATSSAVIGLPDSNFASSRRWKVMLLPSGATSQLVASTGTSLVGSARSGVSSRS